MQAVVEIEHVQSWRLPFGRFLWLHGQGSLLLSQPFVEIALQFPGCSILRILAQSPLHSRDRREPASFLEEGLAERALHLGVLEQHELPDRDQEGVSIGLVACWRSVELRA